MRLNAKHARQVLPRNVMHDVQVAFLASMVSPKVAAAAAARALEVLGEDDPAVLAEAEYINEDEEKMEGTAAGDAEKGGTSGAADGQQDEAGEAPMPCLYRTYSWHAFDRHVCMHACMGRDDDTWTAVSMSRALCDLLGNPGDMSK